MKQWKQELVKSRGREVRMRVLKGRRGEEGPVVVNGIKERRCLCGELAGKREFSGIGVWARGAEEEGL